MWDRRQEFLLHFGLKTSDLTTFVLLGLFLPPVYNVVATKCLRDCTRLNFFFPFIICPFSEQVSYLVYYTGRVGLIAYQIAYDYEMLKLSPHCI